MCFRARSREDVDRVAEKLKAMKAFVDRGPMDGDWISGYYFIVFEDPDGIRLEVNFVPGKGALQPSGPLSLSNDPDWDQNPSPSTDRHTRSPSARSKNRIEDSLQSPGDD
jgi:hypothetical protein